MSIKTSGLARTVRNALSVVAASTVLITPFAAFAAPAAAPAPCDTVGSTIITVTQNVTEPDSGANGNWANDTFTENVNIWQAADGTFCAAGNTSNGTFTTTGPNSPGGTDTNNLSSGITGTFTGGETWIFPAGTATTTSSTNITAPDDNSATGSQFKNWQQYVFNSTGTNVDASGYSFTYVTANHGSWTNADTGSTGDITNESTPAAPASPTTVTVTPSIPQGWNEVSAAGATSTIVADSSHTGNGALRLTTTSDVNSVTHYYSPALSIPLDSVSKLSYDTKQVSAADQTNGNATLRINLNLAGTGTTVDDQLMYEPYYNGFSGSTGWNTWTITPTSGEMWSNDQVTYNGISNTSGSGGAGQNVTLEDVLHDYPNAKIVGVGVTMGSYNVSQNVLADDVNIAAQSSNTTYDFEQDAPAVVPTGCVSGCAGSSGGGGGGSASVSSNSTTNTGAGAVLGASTGPGEVLGASTFNFTANMTVGVTSADVTALQQFLIANGYSIPAGATGYFGAQTKAAVMAFQKANGLPATGYVGPLTIALLDKGTIETNPMMSTNPTSDSAHNAALMVLASILQQALTIQAEISAMATSTAM